MNRETKTHSTGSVRVCQNCKQNFVIEPEDFDFYEKIKVPPPTWCPECRLRRRMIFRNERNYYRRQCDLCRKNIISGYSEEYKSPVYCQKCWWSDKWDPYKYGRDFDFSRSFFEQFKEIFRETPVIALMNDDGVGSLNCEYTYDWSFSKNVYMSSCGWYVENGLYLYYVNYAKDVMDSWGTNRAELGYELVNCNSCYNSKYCALCFDCHDCILSYDLKGCSNCTMCAGLRNKQYCILNQQYSKDEYVKKVGELELNRRSSFEIHKKDLQELVLSRPHKFAYNLKTFNSTGDILLETKYCKDCFYVIGPTENSRYVVVNDRAHDIYDCNNTGNPELCYESITPDNSKGNKFSIFCWKCTEAEYSNNCHSCTSIFGCNALKHGSYVVLNKRYSKEEFMKLRTKIVEHMKKTGEWGEFFHPKLSPFAYNETAAMEWLPLTREEILKRGYKWKEMKIRDYVITKTAKDLPEIISEVDKSILRETIACEHAGKCDEPCTTAFRITEMELQLYQRMKIPIPILCPNCRHYARLQLRNTPKLYKRKCQCGGERSQNGVYKNAAVHGHGTQSCNNIFQTAYSPDRKEIVYCEACYNAEIV